jgi:hypothetical protein
VIVLILHHFSTSNIFVWTKLYNFHSKKWSTFVNIFHLFLTLKNLLFLCLALEPPADLLFLSVATNIVRRHKQNILLYFHTNVLDNWYNQVLFTVIYVSWNLLSHKSSEIQTINSVVVAVCFDPWVKFGTNFLFNDQNNFTIFFICQCKKNLSAQICLTQFF